VYSLPENEWFCQTASSLHDRISRQVSLSLHLLDFGASQDNIRSPYALQVEVIINTVLSGRLVRTASRNENTRPAAMEILSVRCHGEEWKNKIQSRSSNNINGDGRAWKTQYTRSKLVRKHKKKSHDRAGPIETIS